MNRALIIMYLIEIITFSKLNGMELMWFQSMCSEVAQWLHIYFIFDLLVENHYALQCSYHKFYKYEM